MTEIAEQAGDRRRALAGRGTQARGADPPPGRGPGAHRDAGRAAGQGDRVERVGAGGGEHHRIDPAQSGRAARPAAHQEQGRLHLPAFGQRVHAAGGVLPLARHGRGHHLPGRPGRPAARHRQGAGAGRDPEQAGPPDRRRIRDHPQAPARRLRDPAQDRRASARSRSTSRCTTTSAATAAAIRTSRPRGAISELAQMAAIVDVYDAITADRCYHKGMPAAEALRKIYEWSKFHFNPAFAQEFMRCVGIYPVGTHGAAGVGPAGRGGRGARDQPAGAEGQRVLPHQARHATSSRRRSTCRARWASAAATRSCATSRRRSGTSIRCGSWRWR